MKRYQSHKIVEAAPIDRVNRAKIVGEQSYLIVNGGALAVDVPEDFFGRGVPEMGDYLVRYMPDGYLSWSPKAVFEAGYTACAEPAPRGDVGHAEA